MLKPRRTAGATLIGASPKTQSCLSAFRICQELSYQSLCKMQIFQWLFQQVSYNDKMKSKGNGGVHSETFKTQRRVGRKDAEMNKCARWKITPSLGFVWCLFLSYNNPRYFQIWIQWASCIVLLVRTAIIKAFTFTPKMIHIWLEYIEREDWFRETSEEGWALSSRRASLCSNVAAGVCSFFFCRYSNSCDKWCLRRHWIPQSVWLTTIPAATGLLEELIFFPLTQTGVACAVCYHHRFPVQRR